MTAAAVVLVALILASAGCVRADRFRYVQNQPECFPKLTADPVPGAGGEQRPWPSVDCHHLLYTTAYVEFDGRGTAIDPEQTRKALALIERARAGTPDGKIIAVVYVHGWKNNADSAAPGGKPQDVEKFQTALLELAYRSRAAARAAARTPVPVVGVYLGWPGKSLRGPDWFTFVSYWGRRNTANRVGGGADLAATLNSVIDAVNAAGDQSRVLLVGHSFGARVLEYAIEQRQVPLFVRGPGPNEIRPRVDLALYVNSANDARLSMARVEALRREPLEVRHPDYDPAACARPDAQATRQCRDYPILVAITSRGDLATKYLLPTANRINLDKDAPTPPRPTGEFLDPIPSEGTYARSAAAHTPFLQSHAVVQSECPPAVPALASPTEEERVSQLVDRAVLKALGKDAELQALDAQQAKAAAAARAAREARLEALLHPSCRPDSEGCRFAFRTRGEQPVCFQVVQRAPVVDGAARRDPFNRTAFWIMNVDPVVIKDHGDIWNLSFVEMLGQLMAPRGFFEPGAGRMQLRQAAAVQ